MILLIKILASSTYLFFSVLYVSLRYPQITYLQLLLRIDSTYNGTEESVLNPTPTCRSKKLVLR